MFFPGYDPNDDLAMNIRLLTCQRKELSRGTSMALLLSLTSVAVLAFAIILVYCYLRIFLLVRKSRKSLEGSRNTDRERMKKEMGLIKTMIAVLAFFLVTFLTPSLMSAVDSNRQVPWALMVVASQSIWLSPAVNWLIYGWFNPHFRESFRSIALVCCPTSCLAENNNVGPGSGTASVTISTANTHVVPTGVHE